MARCASDCDFTYPKWDLARLKQHRNRGKGKGCTRCIRYLSLYFLIISPRGLVVRCPFCAENLFRAEKLSRHLFRNECNFQYSCNHCDAKLRTEKLLGDHIKSEH